MKKEDLKNELNSEVTSTENGMLVYETSGSALTDFFFQTSSMRNMNEEEIYSVFLKAYAEDPILALKMLFFLRDREYGLGERRSFRIIFKKLVDSKNIECLIPWIPYYGRWDDILCLLDCDRIRGYVLDLIYNQLMLDISNMKRGTSVSLLGKWLPSLTSKKQDYRKYASLIRKHMGLSAKEYRKLCKKLRSYLNVIETKISRNKWDEVNYNTVPSLANLLYRNAFLVHDEERRLNYLKDLSKNKSNVKINAKELFAYDICSRYRQDWLDLRSYDETLELLWKGLPNYMPENDSAIVVADSSGSMFTRVGNSSVTAYDVAFSLAMYMSEHLKGEFKDSFITFSSRPKLVDMSKFKSLHDKIEYYDFIAEYSNTNIEKVFYLILNTALKNNYTQEQLPSNIIICSDMEFDMVAYDYNGHYNIPDFEEIKRRFEDNGYFMPKLTFWNILGRTNGVPLKQNKDGICFLSGFSQAIVDMAFSNKIDPYEVLIEKLESNRYKPIERELEYE